jgi:hypothetical protein
MGMCEGCWLTTLRMYSIYVHNEVVARSRRGGEFMALICGARVIYCKIWIQLGIMLQAMVYEISSSITDIVYCIVTL